MNPLGKTILKNVSRSFYLSIRLLPVSMREPIALAYLLARASDTLADTTDLDAETRRGLLGEFSDALHNHPSEDWLESIREKIIPRQHHDGEKTLLENLSGVFDWLATLQDSSSKNTTPYSSPSTSARHHQSILTVMEHILRGQRLDIERFELRSDFRFQLDSELEEYCYLVAGCVGEFWTDVGFNSEPHFATIELTRMKTWGKNYGKGLQLINILRDLPNDLKQGRCYLPNVDPSNIEQVEEAAARWRKRARSYIADAKQYATSLTAWRIRTATTLPAIIGNKTLDLLDHADWSQLQSGIKIPRRQVYLSLLEAAIR